MKKLFFLLVPLLLVVGCSSQSDYRKAKNGGFGYTETKLSDTQFRVHFKARGSDKAKAMDYAMLRAAELTLLEGYDWFTVNDRETLVDKESVKTSPQVGFSQRYATVTECGALSCRTTRYPTTQFQTGIFVGGAEKSEIESILSIKMGKGTMPSEGNSFDASSVKANLSPKEQSN
ncbi:CC0125/CC1285 family lipoprotein [Alteromonas halophila]|uniref:Lipoprotein n=1 Tax=Alteromonas halophila TaxID=516698 RepID=A0A918JPS0_9ALTE|nr:hypothetical protein [Alteromonas halophila]GGW94595.1 hypothetical protein GCM10007391_31020 [Alteromonas halophila]